MKSVAFAVPGELTIPTGGYAYDRRIIAELRALGWQVEVLNLGDEFPRPSADARRAARTRLIAPPKGMPIVIDGLALGTLPEVGAELQASHNLIALVHHPLALETGLQPDEAAELLASERQALAAIRHVIVTSPFTARLLTSGYDVPASRIKVVRPGIDRVAAPAAGNMEGELSLLAVGSVVPRKGYDVLIAALASLRDLRWHLTVAGDRTRDVQTTARLDADIARFALQDRIVFTGALSTERLTELYASADLFTLASRFEGYGMAFADAIANGLAVVGTTAGAIPETVPASAAILVSPDDIAAMSDALRLVIGDAALRGRLATCARAFAGELPTWRQSAELFSQAIAAT